MRIRLGIIRQILREAPVSPKQASAAGLALYMYGADSSAVRQVTLYSPQAILERILSAAAQAAKSGKEIAAEDFFNEQTLKINAVHAVKGMITMAPPARGECNGAWIVKQAAAQKGHGPMVYDLAMGLAPNNTIMPDRHSVSAAASGIWNFYASKRGDVEKLPLDDIDNPQTPQPNDDCDVHRSLDTLGHLDKSQKANLDTAFKSATKTDPARLGSNHDAFVSVVERVIKDNNVKIVGNIKNKLEEMLDDLASASFLGVMNATYGG